MEKLIFAEGNNRELNFTDKIFGISSRAQEMAARCGKEKVINATIGSLLDDDGKLIVFEAVEKALRGLTPDDFAAYAPILGLPEYLEIVQKYAFGTHKPDLYTAACATPGGAGTIHNAIVNYSEAGDTVITSDWYWAAYQTLVTESYRKLDTYALFDENGRYNIRAFEECVEKYLAVQDSLLMIINTPAHNPTGFSLTNDDWQSVLDVCRRHAEAGKRLTIFVDAAYIDFTEDPDQARSFLELFSDLPENVLGLLSYSASKSFTLYGMRCGALICMSKSAEICEEFKNVMTFSSRGTWSNGTRAAQQLLINLYRDAALKEEVDRERDESRKMLLARGKAFEDAAEECGLKTLPYDSGFFASVPCTAPEQVGEILQKEGIFAVPLAKGLRVALSAVPEKKCAFVAHAMKQAMDEYFGK